MNKFIDKAKALPVPILPTLTGLLTLSNLYNGLGFSWIRHLSMLLAAIIWLMYLVKICLSFDQVKQEYLQVIPASLYGGFTMTLMILSSYLAEYQFALGRSLWLVATILHIVHILAFTLIHFRANFMQVSFMPSWFVTYNGLAVSVVIGGNMGFEWLQKVIAIYCVLIYLALIPFMVKRLMTLPIPKPLYHSQAIVVAPVSLAIVSYLNTSSQPMAWLVYLLYLMLLISLVYYAYLLPRFLSFNFFPAFAGTTFPMAIGAVASGKVAGFLNGQGLESLGAMASQIQGIQIYVTTIVVGYVFIRFFATIMDVDTWLLTNYPDND
ncbi:TDT family transporter [Hutsoniella sourekii]